MTEQFHQLRFERLDNNAPVPYELLLLADPSREQIDGYLKQSDLFVAKKNGETVGIIVLFPLTAEEAEIKNIAVKPEFQGRGTGRYLIENIIQLATVKKLKSITIGTANSSIGQLYLYQKLGFEISGIKTNFFTDNYPDPIFENGIQAKHLVVLKRRLDD